MTLWGGDIYLKKVIRGVVHEHDESPSTDVVNTPREADEEDGRHMVNNLLLEVLERMKHVGRRRVTGAGEKKLLGVCIYVLHVLRGSVWMVVKPA